MTVPAPEKQITAIIPCYNEAAGIVDVIESFPRAKLARHSYRLDILVVDNNSTDSTAEIAGRAGARVVHEPRQGKGHAMRAGFRNLPRETGYVVMLDGDNTYKAQEILRLVEPIESGFSEVIVGSRLGGRARRGSMKVFNRIGNLGYSLLARALYKVNVTDCLSGYFAWSRNAVEDLSPHLVSDGFAIEMEMITKMARLGYGIYSVPVTYDHRKGSSSLRPLADGAKILSVLIGNLGWTPGPVQRIEEEHPHGVDEVSMEPEAELGSEEPEYEEALSR